MKFADVAVNSPFAQRQSFCYSIPPKLDLAAGQAVWVPFGPRILQGVIVKLTDFPSFEETKEIVGVISSKPLLSQYKLDVALWMSEYYIAPLFDCIALMLPPGFERKLNTYLEIVPKTELAQDLNPEQNKLLRLFAGHDRLSLKDAERELGKAKAARITKELIRKNLLFKVEELADVRVKPKLVSLVEINRDIKDMGARVEKLFKKKAPKRNKVIEYLSAQRGPVELASLRKATGCDAAIIRVLLQHNLIVTWQIEVRRDPLARYNIISKIIPELTNEQSGAWDEIGEELSDFSLHSPPKVFLLEGVTGSGKTELYLRALTKVVSTGRKGICLVPEISLTPQTIERFASRFPGRVAMLHSGLTIGEQYDEWRRIEKGECDVVIGPRGALFAPQRDLGLIIIDEEHEWTYKQADKSPRYHARAVALKIAELSGATVILGSATPDLESHYRAERGRYRLVSLKERITVRGLTPMPEVEIVDMREELKSGNSGIFSRSLIKGLSETLQRNEQAVLFLNRRGAANYARCLACGFVIKCPRCMLALAYHSQFNRLICHHCNYRTTIPEICPQCYKPRIRLFGFGTEKVEQETGKLFPKARIIRWDSDVVSGRNANEAIMEKLIKHEADILIGTQIVAKGLDLPQITLAGVVSADTGLNLPDIYAAERVFQLTCQIAGRSGRGLAAGRAIVQTYSPDHYAIRAAAKHDYLDFYQKEMAFRKPFGYPPYGSLVALMFNHTNENACHQEADRMVKFLTEERDRKGIINIRFIGPAPAFIPRIRGRYRWQLTLCGNNLSEFLNHVTFPKGWTIDIDPATVI